MGIAKDITLLIAAKKHVQEKYRNAFCVRDPGGYSIQFKRKHIHYIICASSKSEQAAWRKAEREIYGRGG